MKPCPFALCIMRPRTSIPDGGSPDAFFLAAFDLSNNGKPARSPTPSPFQNDIPVNFFIQTFTSAGGYSSLCRLFPPSSSTQPKPLREHFLWTAVPALSSVIVFRTSVPSRVLITLRLPPIFLQQSLHPWHLASLCALMLLRGMTRTYLAFPVPRFC